MSGTDQEASYITLLEENIDKLEQELSLARMEAEHEAVERDHELANFIDYGGKQNLFINNLLDVVNRYIAHFDKHSLNYMSDELRKITQEAKKALTR
jgi:hypothetical protein